MSTPATSSEAIGSAPLTAAFVAAAVGQKRPTWHWVAAAVTAVPVVATPFLVSDFDLFQLSRMLTIGIGVAALTLLLGHAGQVSVGHGALFGLGAYTSMLSILHWDLHWVPAVLLASGVTLVAGLLIGLPVLRLGAFNIGLLTIAIAAIFPILLIRGGELTGGAFGLALTEPALTPPAWLDLTNAQFAFLVAAAAAALVTVLLANLTRGRVGRAVAALRVSPTLAVSHGVSTRHLTLVMFALSAAVAGFAGALNALIITMAVPDSYLLTFSITLLTACVVGGSRSWIGALLGAALIVYLPEWASEVVPSASAGQWAALVYGIALVLCLIFAPNGLAGGLHTLANALRARTRRAGNSEGK